MKITELPAVQMINPWSGAQPSDKCWNWAKIRRWANDSIHQSNRAEWLKAAREAYLANDGDTLGSMIIGS